MKYINEAHLTVFWSSFRWLYQQFKSFVRPSSFRCHIIALTVTFPPSLEKSLFPNGLSSDYNAIRTSTTGKHNRCKIRPDTSQTPLLFIATAIEQLWKDIQSQAQYSLYITPLDHSGQVFFQLYFFFQSILAVINIKPDLLLESELVRSSFGKTRKTKLQT